MSYTIEKLINLAIKQDTNIINKKYDIEIKKYDIKIKKYEQILKEKNNIICKLQKELQEKKDTIKNKLFIIFVLFFLIIIILNI
tara:strand:- start:4628 stop:4879 length:252 start_codon:yes stop_codon:yes gene_type:complete